MAVVIYVLELIKEGVSVMYVKTEEKKTEKRLRSRRLFFCEAKEIIFIGYLQEGKTITGEYYEGSCNI